MALSRPKSSWSTKVLKDEYQNWLVVGHALSLMCDGLRPYIEREVKAFYHLIATNVGVAAPCACPLFPRHHVKTCAWSVELQRHHASGRPKWQQSDNTMWTDPNLGYWEVAKLYMSDLGAHKADVVDSNSTDTTGLVNLLYWCNNLKIQKHLVHDVRETRNTKWGHAASQELSNVEKTVAIKTIENLLQDPELIADPDAQNSIAEIKKMEKCFDVESVERKVMADFQNFVTNKFDDVQGEIQEMKKENEANKKTKRRLLALEKEQERFGGMMEDIITWQENAKSYGNSGGLSTFTFCCKQLLVSGFAQLRGSVSSLQLKWRILLILLMCIPLADKNSYEDRCPLEDSTVPLDLREFNFTTYLEHAKENFIGRRWLYDEIEQAFETRYGKGVSAALIIGEPGAGKSALSAQLICSRSSSPAIHKHVIGYHLCKYSDRTTQDAGRFVRNLADMIARRIPEYGYVLANSSLMQRMLEKGCILDPNSCFEQGVLIPLGELWREGTDSLFIVVDALDECRSSGNHVSTTSTIIELIQDKLRRLPSWIKFIMTSRNETSILRAFKQSTVVITLASKDQRNYEDIELYITTKMYQASSFYESVMAKLSFAAEGNELTRFTQNLLKQGQGNFLFIKEMLQYWESEPIYSFDFKGIPKTIEGIYESYFKRIYGNDFKFARGILEVLVSAFVPLKAEEIYRLLQLRDVDYHYDFLPALNRLSHFIRYGEDNGIILFHLSLIEWLTSKDNVQSPYFVNKEHGHKRFADDCLEKIRSSKGNEQSNYILCFAQHVAFGGLQKRFRQDFAKIPAHSINSTVDEKGRTLLHLAAAVDNPEVLKMLVPSFSSVDIRDKQGLTPAITTAVHGFVNNLAFLLSEGADLNQKTDPPPKPPYHALLDPVVLSKSAFWSYNMLHVSSAKGHVNFVNFLLQKNVSVIESDAMNKTALHLAAANGHFEVVKLLYKYGSPVDQPALHHAAANGHAKVVAFLLGAGATDKCLRCDGSFYWTKGKQRYQTMLVLDPPRNLKLLNQTSNFVLIDDWHLILCETALHAAIKAGHLDVVKILLGANETTITCADFSGRTPIHVAARYERSDVVEVLLDSGARTQSKCKKPQNISTNDSEVDILYTDEIRERVLSDQEISAYRSNLCPHGSYPIHITAKFGNKKVAEKLLKVGASLYSQDSEGATPLHVAACHGQIEFLEWLVESKFVPSVNRKSSNGSTPLHSGTICERYDILQRLLEISNFDNIGAFRDNYGLTPLHYSVLREQRKPVKVCMNVTAYDKCILQMSTSENESTLVSFFSHLPTFYRMIAPSKQCRCLSDIIPYISTAKIDDVDFKGRTALHYASKNGEECSVSLLLEYNANTEIEDYEGKTAVELAIENFRTFCIYNLTNGTLYSPEQFLVVLAMNYKQQSSVVDLLLKHEENTDLVSNCNGRNVRLLHHAIEYHHPAIVHVILLRGINPNCKDKNGRTPLITHLQNGGKFTDVILMWHRPYVTVKCGYPFNVSEFHLLAYRVPTYTNYNFFESGCAQDSEYNCILRTRSSLETAIESHPLRYGVINDCRDREGFTALHRAAQGGNLLMIKKLLSWGADPTILTPNGHTPLTLAIMYIKNSNVFMSSDKRLASEVSVLLLQETVRRQDFEIDCSGKSAKLTIYHLAAYEGLTDFVKSLFEHFNIRGFKAHCPDVNGVTPLFLAKMNLGAHSSSATSDPWQEVVNVIESHGAKLYRPRRNVKYYLTYKHLFGSFLNPFRVGKNFSNFLNLNLRSEKSRACFKRNSTFYSKMWTDESKRISKELFTNENRVFLSLVGTLDDGLDKRLVTLVREVNNLLKTHNKNFAADVLTPLPYSGNSKVSLKKIFANVSPIVFKDGFKYTQMEKLTQQLQEIERIEERLQHTYEIHTKTEKEQSINFKQWTTIIASRLTFAFKPEDTKHTHTRILKAKKAFYCLNKIMYLRLFQQYFLLYVQKSRSEDIVSLSRTSVKDKSQSFEICKTGKLMHPLGESEIFHYRVFLFLLKLVTKGFPHLQYLDVLTLGLDPKSRIPLPMTF